MKNVFTLLFCTLSLFACASDNKQVIQLTQLPQAAQTTISTYAANQPIALIVMEKDMLETEYEVRFQNGNEWKFDEQGQVESLDNHVQALPLALIPAPIAQYVDQNFSGQSILEYSIDRRHYEIKLSSGIELKFNQSFQLIETDLD